MISYVITWICLWSRACLSFTWFSDMKLWLIDDLPVILSTLKQNVDSKERVLQLRLQSRVIVTKLWIKFIVKVNGDSDLTINESEKLMKHLFICNVDADKFWLEWPSNMPAYHHKLWLYLYYYLLWYHKWLKQDFPHYLLSKQNFKHD